jgi:ATP-dependent RNA helicase DDX51/DBP6
LSKYAQVSVAEEVAAPTWIIVEEDDLDGVELPTPTMQVRAGNGENKAEVAEEGSRDDKAERKRKRKEEKEVGKKGDTMGEAAEIHGEQGLDEEAAKKERKRLRREEKERARQVAEEETVKEATAEDAAGDREDSKEERKRRKKAEKAAKEAAAATLVEDPCLSAPTAALATPAAPHLTATIEGEGEEEDALMDSPSSSSHTPLPSNATSTLLAEDPDDDPLLTSSLAQSSSNPLTPFPVPGPLHPEASASSLHPLTLPHALTTATIISSTHTVPIFPSTTDSEAAAAGVGSLLSEKMRSRLGELGVKDLFAVQTGVIPFLLRPATNNLPGSSSTPSSTSPSLSSSSAGGLYPMTPGRDICVSAPTGSGKTLSYVVPVVEVRLHVSLSITSRKKLSTFRLTCRLSSPTSLSSPSPLSLYYLFPFRLANRSSPNESLPAFEPSSSSPPGILSPKSERPSR